MKIKFNWNKIPKGVFWMGTDLMRCSSIDWNKLSARGSGLSFRAVSRK